MHNIQNLAITLQGSLEACFTQIRVTYIFPDGNSGMYAGPEIFGSNSNHLPMSKAVSP